MTSSSSRQMKLGAFFHPTGHHVASWLHPQAQIDADVRLASRLLDDSGGPFD